MALLFLSGAPANFLAIGVFLIASLTDYWDGRIARKRNQITRLGKFMDPIADKILTLSAFAAFLEMRLIPAWMIVVIFTRDLLITGLRMAMPKDSQEQSASKSGKHKTALQFLSIMGILIFLFLKETVFWKPEWTAPALRFIYQWMIFIVVVTLWSGIRYVMANKRFIYPGL